MNPNVEMMLAPDMGKAIPMPPRSMRAKIELRMKRGEVPAIVRVSDLDLRQRCGTNVEMLGCVTELSCSLGIIYVRKGLSREMDRMARVHEYAHCLYGWKHD